MKPTTAGSEWVLIATSHEKRASELRYEVAHRTRWNTQRIRSVTAALRLLNGGRPSLALVDADLPGTSCEELAFVARRRGIPVVVLEFGRMDPSVEAAVLAAGADEYVDASTQDHAWRRIHQLLESRERVSAPGLTNENCYRIDGLYVDLARTFVSLDGVPLLMQPLEFALLRYFLRRRNSVISRDEFWRAVWRKIEPPRSRTIDVHVCRLRRHLGPVGDHIQTLIGLGYRLVEGIPLSDAFQTKRSGKRSHA
jgi:DNA-binding response OmpR family regulator